MAEKENLTESLKQLEEISRWFNEQEEVDVEAGLTKVREAAKLLKISKSRLKEIENEFHEIEKEIEQEVGDEEHSAPTRNTSIEEDDDIPVNLDEIPF